MAGLSIWHVLIFAIVVILLFGTSKLKNLGKDVGGAIKDFKKSVKDEEAEMAKLQEPRTIDAQVKTPEEKCRQAACRSDRGSEGVRARHRGYRDASSYE